MMTALYLIRCRCCCGLGVFSQALRRDSIYRWIDAKGLPAHRIGRLWKFKVSEVDDWVRGCGARDDDARKRDGS
jgi:excisionase family DNA binding protein